MSARGVRDYPPRSPVERRKSSPLEAPVKRFAPVLLLLPLAACDFGAILQAALANDGGPYGEGPLEVQSATLAGRLAGDTFEAQEIAPSGQWNESAARVEMRAPGRVGYGMAYLEVMGAGLDDPAFAPGNEYTVHDYEELRPGGPMVAVVGCWAAQEGEAWSYDERADGFHLAVEPGERPDEVLFRVTAGLLHEERSEPLELTVLARRALTAEQQGAKEPAAP